MPILQDASFGAADFTDVNVAFNFPISFRDRHHFLHDAYNSFQDPEEISAKRLESISQTVGLTMEEVMSWFVDEKLRRAKLLATHSQPDDSAREFPLSPESMTSPESSTTVTVTSSPTSPRSPGNLAGLQGIFSVLSSPTSSSQQRPSIAARGKRGRRPKTPSTHANLQCSSEPKRQKLSFQYPCTDCGKELLAERWSEHMKRVHFPDNVWECPKTNDKTGRPCCADPFYRSENFATHLSHVHSCAPDEIAQLKVSCKYAVSDFYHKTCGICGNNLKSRDQSLDHIRDHFKEISQRPFPPVDLGASEWKENCGSEHVLQRGIHYRRSEKSSPEIAFNQKDENENNGGSDQPGRDEGLGENSNIGSTIPRDETHGQQQEHESSNRSADAECGTSPGMAVIQGSSMAWDFVAVEEGSSDRPYITSQPVAPAFGHILGAPSQKWSHSDNADSSGYSLSFVDPQLQPGPGIVGYAYPQPPYSQEYNFYSPPTPGLVFPSSPAIPISSNESPYLYSSYPCSSSRPSLESTTSCSAADDATFSSDESREKGRCPNRDCGKIFKDLKAHMLTHQIERPEKCPIATCEYSVKGFARKYDKNRHTLTHYKGTMVCGFCPGSGSPAEKSFNRADVFKRHLTSVHGVEQTPPNSRKKMTRHSTPIPKKLSSYAPDATGKCTTCSSTFENAQDFYEHLDDCVLRVVCQDLPHDDEVAQASHQKALEEYSRGKEPADAEA